MGLNRFGLVTVRAEVLQPVAVKVGKYFELIDITAVCHPARLGIVVSRRSGEILMRCRPAMNLIGNMLQW